MSEAGTRIPLNREVGYCRSWTPANGVREFVQNWWDAVRDVAQGEVVVSSSASEGQMRFTATDSASHELGKIEWSEQELLIANQGTIGPEVLALGNSSKQQEGAKFAGGHGEGLKVGALALVRARHTVQLETNGQRWHFEVKGQHLEVSSSEHATVQQGQVRVSICPAGNDIFRAADFLFLMPAKKVFDSRGGQRQEGTTESLLLDPEHEGRIYSHGILVEVRRDLKYGLNLKMELHRDRMSVASHHTLRKSIGYLWADAVADATMGPELQERFIEVLQSHPQSLEAEVPGRFWVPMIEQFPFHVVEELHIAVRALQHHFREVHPHAFPCLERDVRCVKSSLGQEAVPCSAAYLEVLQCSTAKEATQATDGASQAFSTLTEARRTAFVDPSQHSAKEINGAILHDIHKRAYAAFGVEAADIVFKPASVAEIDALRLGEQYLINDRYLDPEVIHQEQGGCMAKVLGGGSCRCSQNFIVGYLMSREYGKGGRFRAYCERDIKAEMLLPEEGNSQKRPKLH